MDEISICVVDDEPHSHLILKSLAKGYTEKSGPKITLTHFTCGQDLLAEVKEKGCLYDCIVIDVCMPGCSGPDLFHSLVRLRCPSVLLYYSSALNEYETRSCMISKASKTPIEDIMEMYKTYKTDHLNNMFKMAIRTTELQSRIRCRS